MINTQIMYYCKLKPGLSKLPCKEKTVLPTKCVRFFQDETYGKNMDDLKEKLVEKFKPKVYSRSAIDKMTFSYWV